MNPIILDTLRSNLAGSTERAQLVGTGMKLRFMETGASVETLMSITGDPAMTDAVAWWYRLDADQQDYLTIYARISASQLRLQAEDLEMHGGDNVVLLTHLLERRDELASMFSTLYMVDATEELVDALEAADAVLRPLTQRTNISVVSPYLAAVAHMSLSSWWAMPARLGAFR